MDLIWKPKNKILLIVFNEQEKEGLFTFLWWYRIRKKCHFLLFFRFFFFCISIYLTFTGKKYWKKRKKGTRDFFTIHLFLSYDLSCFVEPYLSKFVQQKSLFLIMKILIIKFGYLNEITPPFLIALGLLTKTSTF